MGGAMDLVQGAKKVIVIMEHVSKHGESKVKQACTLPLTGQGVVHRLITDLAVFDFTEQGMVLVEKAADITLEALQQQTEANYIVSEKIKDFAV